MTRARPLTAKQVSGKLPPGRYADGDGLYLRVEPSGTRSWVLIYSRGGRGANKRSELGLGSARDVSLAEAREMARRMRAAIRRGEDPRTARHPERAETFGEAADAYIASMSPGWRNPKHRAQWAMTLGDAYCRSLRPRPVAEVGTADVLAVLSPIWSRVPETASRLRGRIEAVLDAAAARGVRSGENPARWKGHLAKLLPARRTLSRGHHAALPWAEVPGFISALRGREGVAAICLEFVILTACRTGEAIGARWDEIDGDVWTVPPVRMKTRRAHRVPLSPRCLAILDELAAFGSPWVFPGGKAGRPLSNMAMLELVKAQKITVHGFRSSFRDWAAEATSYPGEVVEMCLAHSIASRVEAAYRRGDMLDRRREVMAAWERYCCGSSNVVRLAAR